MFRTNHTHPIALACLFVQSAALYATQVSIPKTQTPTQATTTEQIAQELESLKKDSANGSCAASIKLNTYYNDKNTSSESEATMYGNLARQQYLDNASEASLNAHEENAKTDSDGAVALAKCYENKSAKRNDPKKALYLYAQAALQGNTQAQWRLACYYLADNEVTGYNSVNAYTYYEMCVEKGYGKGYANLAYLSKEGIGEKRDLEYAKKLLDHSVQECGKEKTEEHLKKLNDTKMGFHDGIVYDCTGKTCLFDGQTRIFQAGRAEPFTFACPCTFTSGQEIIICDSCHQLFHLNCFLSWCQAWGIDPAQGCLNTNCSGKTSKRHRGIAL
jgi:hypothetical protein